MTTETSRRAVLTGLAAALASPAVARAPLTSPLPVPRGELPPVDPNQPPSIVRNAGLGGAVGYIAMNAETGAVIDAYKPDLRLPPASVAKGATAYYALSRLGADYTFKTRLLATGPLADGVLKGDLILQGGGDPVLDTDALAEMLTGLEELGLREVEGRFRVDASALPDLRDIDADQPEHVGYNPSISGLNLNFNRVHFEWRKKGDDYEVTMQARADRHRPGVSIATMGISDEQRAVYSYRHADGRDHWTVGRRYLGTDGARWLPVRNPSGYAGEVFRRLAALRGLILEEGSAVADAGGTPLVTHESPPLSEIARGMLLHSTNLTAEVLGLTATRADSDVIPASLILSAREMNLWFNRELGTRATGFVDHSGLGYGSRISARDMAHLLTVAQRDIPLRDLMKTIRTPVTGATVRAKTGTLNFVSALAGYVDSDGKPPMVFATFTADMPRRDAIPPAQRERPPGARGWASRSRTLQKELIGRWVTLASS